MYKLITIAFTLWTVCSCQSKPKVEVSKINTLQEEPSKEIEEEQNYDYDDTVKISSEDTSLYKVLAMLSDSIFLVGNRGKELEDYWKQNYENSKKGFVVNKTEKMPDDTVNMIEKKFISKDHIILQDIIAKTIRYKNKKRIVVI